MAAIPVFFDANGCFGKGARSNPYYYDAPELIEQMDRLGINRSLVWNIAARDYNAAWGNEDLIERINEIKAFDRLIPAYTISMVMYYEEGAVEKLVESMTRNRVRAIRVFPGTLMHSLGQIEPVIDAIRHLESVLFLDSRDNLDPDELLGLAEKYPEIPMVHMQGMWGQLPAMLDLLRRRKNILIDTSWVHTPHMIEMITERFGADRMVFGTGFKSHNGASIAALLDAKISENDRELISHGNLERLLGLHQSRNDLRAGCYAKCGAEEVAEGLGSEGDTLWKRFVKGNDIGLDIIDAHAHLGPSSTLIAEKGEIESQVDYLLPIMDKMNIQTTIVSGEMALFSDAIKGNKLLEKSLSPYKGRFLGYLGFNPFYGRELIPLLDDFFSRDFFIGFKLLCDYWKVPMNDPRFVPVWEYAQIHRLPVLLHTWQGGFSSPSLLKDIAPRYPDAIFILGHSGGGDAGRVQAEDLALYNPNVYLEFCGSFTAEIPFEETLKKVGSDRVIFGTDVMFHNPVWELGRALSMDLPEELLVPMLGANIKRIMSIRR